MGENFWRSPAASRFSKYLLRRRNRHWARQLQFAHTFEHGRDLPSGLLLLSKTRSSMLHYSIGGCSPAGSTEKPGKSWLMHLRLHDSKPPAETSTAGFWLKDDSQSLAARQNFFMMTAKRERGPARSRTKTARRSGWKYCKWRSPAPHRGHLLVAGAAGQRRWRLRGAYPLGRVRTLGQ